MLAEKEIAAPAVSVVTDPIFVAIEMSRSKWVIGTHRSTRDCGREICQLQELEPDKR